MRGRRRERTIRVRVIIARPKLPEKMLAKKVRSCRKMSLTKENMENGMNDLLVGSIIGLVILSGWVGGGVGQRRGDR